MKQTKYIFLIVTFVMSFGCALFVTNSIFGNILFGNPTQTPLNQIQDGDMIFQTTISKQTEALWNTDSNTTNHCGIVLIQNGRKYVFEVKETASYTPLEEWINRGSGKHFTVTRLKEASTILSPLCLQKIRSYANKLKHKANDPSFEWSDDKMYCSELIWKIYKKSAGIQLCPLKKIRDLNLSNQAVQKTLRQIYGQHIPYNQMLVAPKNLKDSKIVKTIFNNY